MVVVYGTKRPKGEKAFGFCTSLLLVFSANANRKHHWQVTGASRYQSYVMCFIDVRKASINKEPTLTSFTHLSVLGDKPFLAFKHLRFARERRHHLWAQSSSSLASSSSPSSSSSPPRNYTRVWIQIRPTVRSILAYRSLTVNKNKDVNLEGLVNKEKLTRTWTGSVKSIQHSHPSFEFWVWE